MSVARWCVVAVVAGALPAMARAGPAAQGALVDEPTLIALAVALAVSPAPAMWGAPAERGAAEAPELELTATVHARSIVFTEVPHVRVSFAGSGPLRTTWSTERVNLPAEVQAGVVYRDVQVKLTLASTPEQLEALLADARRLSRGVKVEPDAPPTAPPQALADTPAAPAR